MRKHQAEPSFRDTQILVNPVSFSKPQKADRMYVVCLECSRKFWTGSHLSECPGCGGSDIELA